VSTDTSRRSGANADRDRILEQALKQELRATGASPSGACLDAETLGAWTDGGLDATTAAAVEAHISNCGRCLALVGTMARGTLSTAGTPDTSVNPSKSGAFAWWKWGLAPLAAGVAAATLWMVIPEEQQVAVAPPQAKQSSAAPAKAAAPPPSTPAAPASRAETEQLAARENAPKELDDRSRTSVVAENKLEAPARIQERAAAADSAGAAASAAARAETPPTTAATPPSPAIVAPAAAPTPQIGALQKSVVDGVDVLTTDRLRKWRIAGDRILRTEDEGKTWSVMRLVPNEGIAAGSAPSPETAWFVGRGGRVLVTADAGHTFTDVSLAEPLDLASVAATDARNAAIYSVSGRRFRTSDAGRTWQPF
jgi:hypothetical protein